MNDAREYSKAERHSLILHMIQNDVVETQQQLRTMLEASGCRVTQATVSRDVKELQLVKVAVGDGYRYAPPPGALPRDRLARTESAFVRYVNDVTFSGHLLVLKTVPGSASVVAAALDDLNMPEVAGTVAGDDAVLVIVKDGRSRPAPGAPTRVYELFQSWRKGASFGAR